MKKLPVLYKNIIVVFMLIILGYLSVSSFFLNADIVLDGFSEKTTFVKTFWPITLLLVLAVIFLLHKFKSRIANADTGKLLRNLLIFDFLLCMLWIVLSNTREGADQAQVLYAAKSFANGDFSKLAADKYMGMFPYQLPLALLYEPFYLLFGDVTPFLWQFINAFLICGIQYLLFLITKEFCDSKAYLNRLLLLQFLDLPLILYVAFIYGTVIGLVLGLAAVYLLLKYISGNRFRHLLLSCFFIACACLVRTNNLILLIAVIIIALIHACTRNKTALLVIPISILFFFGGKLAVEQIYEVRSGMEISKGEPASLNIAMGLSDNEERAAGWYNGYTWDTYLELNCDYEASHKFAMERIQESLSKFASSPSYAFSFFGEKINSMWLNPDFQGMWNCNNHHGYFSSHYVALAPIVYNLFTGELHDTTVLILGNIQFLIYFGAFLCFWGHRKSLDWKQCSLALIFIGGFLFHLFWEAKAQYVIVYYVLLFPYAAAGLECLSKKAVSGIQKVTKKKKSDGTS